MGYIKILASSFVLVAATLVVAAEKSNRPALDKFPSIFDLPADRDGRPFSSEEILQNSLEVLKDKPEDKVLRSRIIRLSRVLAQPQAPSSTAWQILIDEKVLHDGMSVKEARHILGMETHRKDGDIRWYFNFNGRHVHPGLRATFKDNKLFEWRVYLG